MAALGREVTHDHGIVRETYEVMRLYSDMTQRLKASGTDQDAISEDFYMSAVRMYASALTTPDVLAQMRYDERIQALSILATHALRWARKVRIDASHGVTLLAVKDGDTSDDT